MNVKDGNGNLYQAMLATLAPASGDIVGLLPMEERIISKLSDQLSALLRTNQRCQYIEQMSTFSLPPLQWMSMTYTTTLLNHRVLFFSPIYSCICSSVSSCFSEVSPVSSSMFALFF